jgi:orotate phosphoribosyltransferase
MKDYQRQFIEFALASKALLLGEFKLKSGRVSPYFFNAGLFNTGKAIARLGQFYASAIIDAGIEFDMLFGPAYKGIPLVTAVAIALAEQHGIDKPYAFNRKEAKLHGEGGLIVGASLAGKVLVIDDVMSAGVTIGETVAILNNGQCQMAGIILAMDRQERTQHSQLSAVQQVEQTHQVAVLPIVRLENLLAYLQETGLYAEDIARIKAYREIHGA